MTTFAERLALLPERPPLPIQYPTDVEPYRTNKLLRHIMADRDALSAYLRLAVELLEEVANAGVVQSLRQYEELQVYPELRADARALLAKVKGELGT